MKTNLLLLLLPISVLMTSCDLFSNHGKKVKINDKSEVYYKGDGVTEAEAKKLGDYLLQNGYFDTKTEKSVQLTKDETDKDVYVVRFVVNQEALNKNRESSLMTFWYWQDLISAGVFDEKKTRIILTDTKLKDIETLDEITRITVGKEHYVYLKGNSVKEKEGKAIADSLEKADFFKYTAGAVLLTKEKGTYALRFLPNENKQKEDNYILALSDYKYIIAKYILDDSDLDMFIIDEAFNDVKQIKETSDERKAYFDRLIKGEPQYDPSQYTNNQYQTVPTGDDEIRGGSY